MATQLDSREGAKLNSIHDSNLVTWNAVRRLGKLQAIILRYDLYLPDCEELTEYACERVFSQHPRIRIQALERCARRSGQGVNIEFWRRHMREGPSPFVDDVYDTEWSDESLTPEEAAGVEEELRLLRAVTAALPPERREVFRLYWDRGLERPEIAERLGLGAGAVKRHIARASILFLRVQEVLETPEGVVEKNT
ncbi:MAG: sigma-70 family RNA polymerase sigma factor [Gammaproteobacteria bacterium]